MTTSLSQTLLGNADEEQPGQLIPPKDAPPSIRPVLQVVKTVLPWFSVVMDALGRTSQAAALRQFGGMLEQLGRPALPGANNTVPQNRENRDANPAPGQAAVRVMWSPAPDSTPDPRRIDPTLWDRGIEGLRQERVPIGSDRNQPGSDAFWAAALLASRLVGSELDRRRPARSPWTRQPRPRPTGATPRDRTRPRSTP
jgi:hypothetical protein